MSDPSQVFLFGSFTEDEARSLLNKKMESPQKPTEKKESQVNTTKLVTELTFGSFSSISNVNVIPTHGPVHSHSSDIKKENKSFVPEVKENGKVHDSINFSNENPEIIVGISLSELAVSDNDNVTAEKSTPELLNSDSLKPNGNIAAQIHTEESNWKLDFPVLATRDLLPRGLINSGNLCFLNATVQALLACSPFVQLLHELRCHTISKVDYTSLAAFSEFIGEFNIPEGVNLKKKNGGGLESGRPFRPTMFEVILRKFTPDVSSSMSGRPRQEDAQEFLSFILNQMHDELLKLKGQAHQDGRKSLVSSSEDDDDWETVGPKNKSAVTRTQSFVPSELSKIFGGQLRSVIKAKGNKPSATVEPFLLLHLEISHDDIQTIEDALHFFAAPETLDEYRSSNAGKGGIVSARKSINIQALPKIMILHLMRFSYGNNGSTKLHKPVRFPAEMMLSRDLLVSPTSEGRKYELVSTVTHHGREASKGHYTADVRYSNGQWLRFDDASVNAISANKVLHDQAYLLFYRQL